VAFPLPAVGAPLVQAAVENAIDVVAGGNEGDARGARNGLQASDDRKQLQSFADGVRLGVFNGERQRTVGSFQGKTPARLILLLARAGMEQEVGGRHAHNCAIRKEGGSAPAVRWYPRVRNVWHERQDSPAPSFHLSSKFSHPLQLRRGEGRVIPYRAAFVAGRIGILERGGMVP
jgi:hypothetical protein